MHGLMDATFVGLPAPHDCAEPKQALQRLTSPADAADAVAAVGGWSTFQKLLRAAAEVANKHGVTVQVRPRAPCIQLPSCEGQLELLPQGVCVCVGCR